MCLGNLSSEAKRGALIRCLSPLTWLHSMQSRGGSIDDRASHPISGQNPRHPIFCPLAFMISFFRLLPTAFDHRWTEECLSTGKFRALSFGSFTTMCQCRTSVNKGNKCEKLVHNVWGESLTNGWAQCVLRGPVGWTQNQVTAFFRWNFSVDFTRTQSSNLSIVVCVQVWSVWDKNQHLQIGDHGYDQPEKGGGTTPSQG